MYIVGRTEIRIIKVRERLIDHRTLVGSVPPLGQSVDVIYRLSLGVYGEVCVALFGYNKMATDTSTS